MNNVEEKKNPQELRREYKTLAKNSFYNFLNSYGVIFFSMITSFFTARIISQTQWGFLIVALSIVNIFIIVLNFFPPSLGLSFHYYIPRYRSLGESTRLKFLIRNSLLFKFFFVLLGFAIAVIGYIFFTEFFSLNLKSYSYLFFILSPLIIINGLDKIFLDIIRPFNMFKTAFIMIIIRYFLHISGLVLLFLLDTPNAVDLIAFIILFSNFIPFLIDFFIILYISKFKIQKSNESALSFRETLKELYKYGTHLSVQGIIDGLFNEFRIQTIGFFESPELVTGYNIAVHYRNISLESVVSLNKPLVISFSSLYAKEKSQEVIKFFRIAFHYFTFLILIITGVIYFFIDFFLLVVYGNSFLDYSILLKLMIITIIFSVQNSLFFSMLRSSDKIKYIIPISLMAVALKAPPFLIALIYFGVVGAIIALLITNIIYFILIAILNYKIFDIRLNLTKTFAQYIIFFIALVTTLILEALFLSQINYLILGALNLLIFQEIEFLSLFTFLIIYFLLNYIFKTFTRSDIESLEKFFEKESFVHKIIRKGLKFLKKIIRK